MPDVFPYHAHGNMKKCHQAWCEIVPAIDHINPISFGGTNDKGNLICTTGRRNMAKSTSTPEEMGWKFYPAGKLDDWDGMLKFFIWYVSKNFKLFEEDNELNNAVMEWHKACRSLNLI